MRSIVALAPGAAVLLASLLLASCATDPFVVGSVARHHRHVAAKDDAAAKDSAVASKADPRWQWCEQRHLDHQAGKAPAGAQDLEQKLADDRTCAAVYAAQPGRPSAAPQTAQPVETGSISKDSAAGR
jgi:hypothetical protein